MYNISAQAQSYFENNYRQTLLITGTDRNGTAISITEADVMENGFTLDRYSCNGTKLEVGTAIASEISIKLDNRDGRFNDVIFEGTELYVRVGITNGDLSSQVYTLVPLGYFTPDSQPRALSTITITALDRMTRFDRYLPFPVNWTDENGTDITNESGRAIQLAKALTFPSTVSSLISAACNFVGMSYSIPSSLPNRSLSLSSIPDIQQPITLRNIIQWCAGIMGANAWINWNGTLTFSWYNNSATYTTTTANRYNSDLYEDDIAFTGVSYTNTAGMKLVSGTSDYTLDLTGNYLAANYTATILPEIRSSINGFSYRPFSATVNAAPYLWPMDVITFTDRDGTDHTTVLTNVNYTLNGVTKIEGRGETEQLNAMQSTNGLTSEQAFFMEKTAKATQALDESLNQENIFNRLTNNGAAQMLILYEGQLYLNASYIQTGTLVADLIKGGTLTLGGRDNQYGTLQILDRLGNVIGEWNRNGITINTGSINANVINSGTLSADLVKGGTLQVAGDSYWDNTGMHIKRGTIDLRRSGDYGFSVGRYGDIAVGPEPSDLSSFEGNQCPFQVNNGGQVKAREILFYNPPSDGSSFVQVGAIGLFQNNPGGLHLRGPNSNARVFIAADATYVYGSMKVSGGLGITGNIIINPDSTNPKTGANGTFVDGNGRTITVTDGIITGL